ncbi:MULTISPECIES: hypothetical protein [Xanthomonas]|uniref:hypothetical protein n=1 Tax=Xanthomonas TaxID=338 RepID=UPI000573A670|nr:MULTISPECIES: hypothetical protein [Xanthomonas]KHS05255.1 hypothetical protein RM61_22420 [Xanthomonas phaseoli pv. phaseoli]MCP3043280.1 hypothetical protein [Xanthomonas euvesicatoria pv. allii]
MSATRYLIDSDAAKALCQYGLIEDLATALGVTLRDFSILAQLRYQLHLASPAKALRKLGSNLAVDLANLLVAQASEVVVLLESANYSLLEGTPDIDGGELALFAAMCDDANAGLITGDKRSLVALCKVEGKIQESFTWAQILCLEETIAILIGHFGWEYVSDRIRIRPDVNNAVSNIFGRSAPAAEAAISEGLQSYLNELQAKTAGKYSSPYLSALSN